MDKKYWENYYKKNEGADYPSPFALFCFNNYLKPKMKIIELGCGNGRDAFYFSNNGLTVYSVDQSATIIRKNEINRKNLGSTNNLKFIVADFTRDFPEISGVDVIYSRFTMHSIAEDEQNIVLNNAYRILN